MLLDKHELINHKIYQLILVMLVALGATSTLHLCVVTTLAISGQFY